MNFFFYNIAKWSIKTIIIIIIITTTTIIIMIIKIAIQEEIEFRLKAGKSCYYLVQTLLSSRLHNWIELIYCFTFIFHRCLI